MKLQLFGRQQGRAHDMLVKTIEQQAAVIDSAEKQVATLQAELTASITRRADLRHENDLLRQRIAELTDGTSEPPAKEL